MPVRNQNWYDLQAGRRYPLDDRSTGIDDAGNPIRDDIIVDCHIRFPETYGKCAFISGITVTGNIVAVVISARDTLDNGDIQTIAAISVAKPITTNTNYPVQGIVAGAAGWMAFGPGVAENFSARYTTPIQSLLAPRNARPYRQLPVRTLGKYGVSDPLQNVINISAQPPLTAEYEQVTIGGKVANAIVLSLRGGTQNLDYEPLQYFLGPCGARPESGTCPKQPILTINGVAPDCSGNINLDFIDGINGFPFLGCGGIAINTDISLTNLCATDPPAVSGNDECAPSSSSSSGSGGAGSNSSSSSSSFVISSSASPSSSSSETCLTLPLCKLLTSTVGMTTRAGEFYAETLNAPGECVAGLPPTNSTSRVVLRSGAITGTNVLTLDNCASDWAINHRVSAVMRISGGIKHISGVVLNYLTPQQVGASNPRYLVAALNLDAAAFQLLRFNGSTFVTEFSADMETYEFNYDPSAWYVVSITAMPLNPGQVNSPIVVFCELKQVTAVDPEISFSVTVAEYGLIAGTVGIFADQTYTNFSHLIVE